VTTTSPLAALCCIAAATAATAAAAVVNSTHPTCSNCSKALRDESCKVPWSQFCSDPWTAAELLHDRGCIKRSRSYLYFHMEDQYHCLRTATGDWAVDYIGRVDEANTDWAEVSCRAQAAGCGR